MNRETWLNKLAEMMAPRFAELGHPLPKYRVAVGWTSAGKVSHVGAECWHSSKSADGSFEILVSPITDDSMSVAGHLAHELIHAAVGFDCGHKGDFVKMAKALGLAGKMTATVPGPAFKVYAQPFIDALGNLPHARILLKGGQGKTFPAPADEQGDAAGSDDASEYGSSNQKKKQSTRMQKCTCGECGYTVRLTQKWLAVGAPHCPDHGEMQAAGAA